MSEYFNLLVNNCQGAPVGEEFLTQRRRDAEYAEVFRAACGRGQYAGVRGWRVEGSFFCTFYTTIHSPCPRLPNDRPCRDRCGEASLPLANS